MPFASANRVGAVTWVCAMVFAPHGWVSAWGTPLPGACTGAPAAAAGRRGGVSHRRSLCRRARARPSGRRSRPSAGPPAVIAWARGALVGAGPYGPALGPPEVPHAAATVAAAAASAAAAADDAHVPAAGQK